MLTLYQFKLDIDKNKMKNMSTHWFVLAALLLTSLALTRRNEASAQSLEGRCSDPGAVRLVNNGTIGREGRVEVCLRGEWGTVCDDLWDERDAAVICRQLGFATSGAIAAAGAYFGPGTGPILLDNVECTGNEERLTACPNQRIGQHNCRHTEDASVICQPEEFACPDGALRLAGGQGSNEGRVEICIDNQYGTICDDKWDDRDAAVVCAQLGFSRTNAVAVTRTQAYGVGIGRIYFDEVNCIGDESNITECRHAGQGIHNCEHLEDAAVLCRSNDPPSVCQDGEIRLRDGRTSADGRVEICFNERWGTVCDDQFGREEAAVVCRQQGYSPEGATAIGSAAYGQGEGIVFLDSLACFGNETFLRECRHDGIGNHNCGHNEDVSVVCTSPIMDECRNGAVRLVGGTVSYEGRVEVCVNNHWGTVCDDQWDGNEATVICRQLGFTNGNAIALPQALFGSGIGIILLDDVNCFGNESSLLNCSHRGLGINNCGHTEDANVLCPVPEGETKLCENGALRLAGGNGNNEGRVELCFHNRWGTICDDNWSTRSSQVVCRQLGFSSIGALAARGAFFGEGTGPIFLDGISCLGNESNLLQCHSELVALESALGQHDCAHTEDAGVICPAPAEDQTCADGDVRLRGGGNERQGLVEICYNNRWGTICGDDSSQWDKNEAAIVCTQLGYDLADTRAVAVPEGGFGAGSGPIFLDNMQCAGDEGNLLQCRNSGVALHQTCSHFDDAGVICAAIPCIDNEFRLTGGSETSGRVEVCVDGAWGNVCSESFDDLTAAKICKQIGLKAGTAVKTDIFGRALGGQLFSVSIDNSGSVTPKQLEECSNNANIALFCLAEGVQEVCKPGEVRLVQDDNNNYGLSEGRVEICMDNQWGTICDDSWDDNSAAVVCRQLGFEVGRSRSFGAGSSSQPILLDDTKCIGLESNLLQCQANNVHNCYHSEDAGVTCSNQSDTASGLTTDQAVAITVPIIVVTTILVTLCAIIIILIIYTKYRTVKHLDEAPIVEVEDGIIAENGVLDDSSTEKQKFEDKL